MQWFKWLFSNDGFMPRAICGIWSPSLIYLHNASDFLIWTAYVAIPIVLVKLAYSRRRELPFSRLFWLFGLFILACGTTHFMDIVMFYNPLYHLAGVIKLITAVASWGTVFALIHVLPVALQMRSPEELQREIEQRQRAEADLQKAYATLEQRVHERTAELAQVNEELKTNSARLTAIMDNTPAVIYLKDAEGRYLLLNRQFEKTFGSRLGAIVGKTAHDLFPTDIAERLEENDRTVRTSEEPLTIDEEVLHDDGIHTYVTTKVALRDNQGQTYAICGISTDITAHKLTEIELQQAKEQAEQANAAKDMFLSRMSHELRTPLNAILGFGQLLEMEKSQFSEEQNQNIQTIVSAGGHLLRLVDEILDIRRIESPDSALTLEAVSCRAVIEEALDMVKLQAADARIALFQEVAPSLYAIADQKRFLQIMLNLLSNAVKFNKTGGSVRVTAKITDNDRVQLMVSDSGHGIATQDISKLFVPFSRLNADSLGVKGVGLGLLLSQRLAQAMNGSIQVESHAGLGSVFTLELPICKASDALPDSLNKGSRPLTEHQFDEFGSEKSVLEVSPSNSAKKILLIEDNISNFQLVEAILKKIKEVRLIGSMEGRLGIERALEERPDLILLDLHLPDIDGAEVLRYLQQMPETREVPVMVLSADATPSQINALLSQGAVQYLTKPLDVKRFRQVVNEILFASHKTEDAVSQILP